MSPEPEMSANASFVDGKQAVAIWRSFGRREKCRLGEIVVYIGWGFAAVMAFGGVAFLAKMAYWKPEKKRRSRKE